MKHSFFLVIFIILWVAFAWDTVDYEIFDLVGEIERSEGKGVSFYSLFDVTSSASANEIARAYRKKSLSMHPDKNPKVKNIHERFARLGVVAQILRNPETRERYDFFYKNGVPKWRGTGYYYSRYRPGLGSVLMFLVILSSGLQYMVQEMNYNRDIARVEFIVTSARTAAWGPKLTPLNGSRKVKVPLGGGSYDDDGGYNPGKTLELIVDGNLVFLLEQDGTAVPIDASTATRPSLRNTWCISLLWKLWLKLGGGKSSQTIQPVGASDGKPEFNDTSDSIGVSSSNTNDKFDIQKGYTRSMVAGRRRNRVKRN